MGEYYQQPVIADCLAKKILHRLYIISTRQLFDKEFTSPLNLKVLIALNSK